MLSVKELLFTISKNHNKKYFDPGPAPSLFLKKLDMCIQIIFLHRTATTDMNLCEVEVIHKNFQTLYPDIISSKGHSFRQEFTEFNNVFQNRC